jgi:hypothetical protein
MGIFKDAAKYYERAWVSQVKHTNALNTQALHYKQALDCVKLKIKVNKHRQ